MIDETKTATEPPLDWRVMRWGFKISEYPADFIPAGAAIILGMDISSDGDCTVNGFYDPRTGEYHIQEVVHNA